MKSYVKPKLRIIELRAEEGIACFGSSHGGNETNPIAAQPVHRGGPGKKPGKKPGSGWVWGWGWFFPW